MKNRDIINAHVCLVAIINSKEARQNIPSGGKAIYSVMKNHAHTLGVYNEIITKDTSLRTAGNEAIKAILGITEEITEEQMLERFPEKVEEVKAVRAIHIADLEALWNTEQELVLHKIPVEAAEEIGKHLLPGNLVALYQFLVEE